jgi:hypothetical protein
MLKPPILITAPARSGTSMIAGLLVIHGVWVGRARGTYYPETNTALPTENQDVKDFIKSKLLNEGINKWNHFPISKSASFKPEEIVALMARLVPDDTDWLVKTAGLLYHPDVWRVAFPSATWLLPVRSLEDILASMANHPSMRRRVSAIRTEATIAELHRRQRGVYRSVERAFLVRPDQIVSDLDYAAQVVSFCGIIPDKDRIREWIRPDMWRRWEKR